MVISIFIKNIVMARRINARTQVCSFLLFLRHSHKLPTRPEHPRRNPNTPEQSCNIYIFKNLYEPPARLGIGQL